MSQETIYQIKLSYTEINHILEALFWADKHIEDADEEYNKLYSNVLKQRSVENVANT